MGTKMTHTARAELTDVVRRRYCTATGAEKGKIFDEFIAVTGYHQIRVRPALYDEAVQAALIVLWEASDRVCGKRLRALLPILLPALERNGHLHLREPMRQKILAMSASTIDRLLRMPRSATHLKKRRRAMPEARRRVPVRTFADWNEPPPGSMEMDCVAHCGDVNRGSYVNSLVMTDIASGWTEGAPLVVRESGLLVETLERIRQGLPFALRALDVDNTSPPTLRAFRDGIDEGPNVFEPIRSLPMVRRVNAEPCDAGVLATTFFSRTPALCHEAVCAPFAKWA
jgi:hypothetical protein